MVKNFRFKSDSTAVFVAFLITVALLVTVAILFVIFTPIRSHAKSEADYVKEHCRGEMEVVLEDKSRVDCLMECTAYEYDFCKKWAEAIGQSLHYSRMTKRQAGIVLICGEDDQRFLDRIKPLANHLEIKLEIINK